MQCQLTLFNVGYLKGLEGQSVYTLHCYSLRPAGSTEKKPCEKKSSTMDTEEVHNANSFPNTTDCFHHNEGKQPLLLSSTSTNNTLTKPPNPRFVPRQNLLDRLNAPRVGKKFFQLSSSFAQEKKNIIKKGQRKRKKWSLNSQCGFFHSLRDDLCFDPTVFPFYDTSKKYALSFVTRHSEISHYKMKKNEEFFFFSLKKRGLTWRKASNSGVKKYTFFFRSALFYCELNTTRCFRGQEGSSVKRRDRGVTMENIAVKGFN